MSPPGPAGPGRRGEAVPARVVVGSRRSDLARIQARRVAALLRRAWPDLEVEHAFLTTRGDRVLDRPLPDVGGKGLFTAELESALLEGRIDLAVHSLKDLPTWSPEGLGLLAVPEREDPRDVMVSGSGGGPEALPEGAVVGTSSLRRKALLLHHRPDCRVRDVRGNVETRLSKLERGDYDALVLAAAGLSRLDRTGPGVEALDPPLWLPAPGQGALAVQGRTEDPAVGEVVAAIDDPAVRTAVAAERAFLAALEGGCQVPIGALARGEGDEVVLHGIVLSLDGSETLSGTERGGADDAEEVGKELAGRLREQGVERLLAPIRG